MIRKLLKQHQTWRGNSLLKADTIFRQYGHIVVSDDSGLEVQVLNGAPGVCTQLVMLASKKMIRKTLKNYLMNSKESQTEMHDLEQLSH